MIQIVVINGKEYVRIPTKYITVNGKKVDASKYNKKCFFINIPIDKFDPSKYKH